MVFRLALGAFVMLVASALLPFGTAAHARSNPAVVAATQQLLAAINADRAAHHVKPLILDTAQSACSLKHSKHMATEGLISHDQFPADLCTPYMWSAENVGMASGDPISAALSLDQQMVGEGPCPHKGCPGTEAGIHGHYVNLMNPIYTHIGIGICVRNGTVWITEDFTDGKGSQAKSTPKNRGR